MRPPIMISALLAIATANLAGPIAAENLYLYIDDPAGDNSGNIDVDTMLLVFDDQTGSYTLTVTATDSKPFLGNFRVNINLFNPDTGATTKNPAYFGDTFNDYNLATPTTELVLTGTNPSLSSWYVGDRVATTTLSGLGNPDNSTFFRSAVGDLPLGTIFVREDIIGYDDRLAGSIDSGGVGYVSDSTPQDPLADCNLRLVFPSGLNIGGSAPTIGADGSIYVAAGNAYAPGELFVFSINADGIPKAGWPFYLDGSAISTVAVAADGTVYVGSDNQNLYAIESTGKEKWRFNTGDDLGNWKSPAISNDGTVYVTTGNAYTGTGIAKLFAIKPDGTEKWSFSAPGNYDWSPPVVASDGTVYAAALNGFLYALTPNGSEKWRFFFGGWPNPALALDAGGVLYVATGQLLHAILPNGVEKVGWPFALGSHVATGAIVAPDGTIYIGVADGLYAINPSGTEKWFFEAPSINTTPAIGDDGTIYFALWNAGGFYAVNSDGTPQCFSPIGGPSAAPPAIDQHGTVYSAYWNGNLYGHQGSSRGLASSPWPMYQRNPQHTGAACVAGNCIRPSVAANTLRDYASIPPGSQATVRVRLEVDAPAKGIDADWWVAAETPIGWFSYQYPSRTWIAIGESYLDLVPTYQGRAEQLAPYEVATTNGLGAGRYVVYFGLDTVRNWKLDMDQLYFDQIVIDIR